ncbi:MAG: hypothetical protein EOM37_10355 [Proteobacteria bacterium]|nr:hypothetical protein [Pseudomonadota bacterium]
MQLDQAIIDEFFGTIAKKYPGLDNGAEGIRIILSYNRSMTGTDFINFEMRNFFRDPNSSLFNLKARDEISTIVSSKTINSRKDLRHLSKIQTFWNKYRAEKGIEITFGFKQGRLQVK